MADAKKWIIPFHTPAKTKSYENREIPMKIFQTWKSSEVTEEMYNIIQETIRQNPEYDFYFYGDNECKEYLKLNFGQKYIDAFNTIKPGAFKADFWRYCILANEGGIYIDVDMKLLEPISKIIKPETDLIIVKDRGLGDIYQALTGCRIQHPFMVQTMKACYDNIVNKSMGDWSSSLSITGPKLMGIEYNRYNEVADKRETKKYTDETQLFYFDGQFIYEDHDKNKTRPLIKTKVEEYNNGPGYSVKYYTCSVYDNQDVPSCMTNMYGEIFVVLVLVFVFVRFVMKK